MKAALDNNIELSSQLLQQPDFIKTTGMDAKQKEQLIKETEGLCLINQSMYQQ